MAEEKKSNTYNIVVAASIVLSVAFVVTLKDRETEHLNYQASKSVEEEAKGFEGRKDFNNVFE